MLMKGNGCTYTWLLDGVGWKEVVDFLTPSTKLLELVTCSVTSHAVTPLLIAGISVAIRHEQYLVKFNDRTVA